MSSGEDQASVTPLLINVGNSVHTSCDKVVGGPYENNDNLELLRLDEASSPTRFPIHLS